MTIGLGHYLAVGAILFTLGILGIFLNRKNIIVILMSIELILLAVNINLVAFSTFLGDIVGQVFALLVLTVAAAEAAIGLVIGGIFMFELLLVVGGWAINPTVTKQITAAIPTNVSNTEALGLVLYTKYIHYFQIAGMVLLVAMIGAIVLTLRHKISIKRQDINVQNARTPELAMAVRKVTSGQGLQDADAAEWVK